MKYLTKYVQRPYAENDRTLIKEMKHVYKWISHSYGLKDSILLRCHFSPIWSIDSTLNHKMPIRSFAVNSKLILKFTQKGEEIERLIIIPKNPPQSQRAQSAWKQNL